MQEKFKKIYIIDGYNVLRTCKKYQVQVGNFPNFHDFHNESLNTAREALFNDAIYLSDSKTKVVIVYDATNNKYQTKQNITKYKNISIVFTKTKETADEYIENLVFKYREKNIQTIVITNDFQILHSTMSTNVTQMSPLDFSNYVSHETKQIKTNSKFRKTIETQVDKATLNKLWKLRDSL